MVASYLAGINMFDLAEGYAEGNCEVETGRVIREMGWERSDLIVTTKICGWMGLDKRNKQNC